MTKTKTVYTCNDCGATSSKWVGQCPSCNAWNSLTETVAVRSVPGRGVRLLNESSGVQLLEALVPQAMARHSTGIVELDRVLGGGMVTGSVVLIGGDPGIGKSTILLQALAALSQRTQVLYVSGEESADQIALRARRLGIPGDQLRILTENQ